MRNIVNFSLVVLLFGSSCSESSQQQEEEPPRRSTGGLMATISTDGDVGNCSIQWNGDQISTDEIIYRANNIFEAAVEVHNGAENMTEADVPYVRVKAAGDMPYHCVSLVIGVLREIGFLHGEMEVAGEAFTLDVNFSIAGDDLSPDWILPPPVIALDDEGAIFVDGERTPLEDLTTEMMHLQESGPRAASLVPVMDYTRRPDFFLLPSARTRFARTVQTARSLTLGGISFELVGCYLADIDVQSTADQIGTPLPAC